VLLLDASNTGVTDGDVGVDPPRCRVRCSPDGLSGVDGGEDLGVVDPLQVTRRYAKQEGWTSPF
jgi:hypothetical protein